ncbi:hypothetical protein [Trichocoleus sp. FACHB-262]|uniref:hypothetical protein n=1 Tax=Trichocoleus sp. FACHB-262 TaxID=2692869 RepID=UPI0016867ECB|nr:hypothetical protein [Trichocoleus sp. FACHB-262]MBD2124660.1 hypothetical protein [Trichocoleus sp. FACHB-262]
MPRKPSLESLRATLQRLNLQQKQEIYAWLGEAIASEVEVALAIPPRPEAAVTEQRHYQGKTYQREKRRCNRIGCKCMAGEVTDVGHGPYWYAYWKEQGKVCNQYVGKRTPWEEWFRTETTE